MAIINKLINKFKCIFTFKQCNKGKTDCTMEIGEFAGCYSYCNKCLKTIK